MIGTQPYFLCLALFWDMILSFPVSQKIVFRLVLTWFPRCFHERAIPFQLAEILVLRLLRNLCALALATNKICPILFPRLFLDCFRPLLSLNYHCLCLLILTLFFSVLHRVTVHVFVLCLLIPRAPVTIVYRCHMFLCTIANAVRVPVQVTLLSWLPSPNV